jgi:hypothetical protein
MSVEVTKFYKQLKSFLKNLILVFPEDREMKVISSAINIAMMDDPEKRIIHTFYDALEPHEVLIFGKNDELFYQDPENIVKRITNNNHQYKLFSKLNVCWETLNEENRKIVWEYIDILYRISKGIVESSNRNVCYIHK